MKNGVLLGMALWMTPCSVSWAQDPVAESPVMNVNPDEPRANDSKAGDDQALGTAAAATGVDIKEKKFTGSPITLKMRDADVNEVMRLISEASGFNIVLNPAVKGTVTVSLENVPWDQALEVVMTTLDLAAERNESVLKVMPREMLLKQKQQELENAKLSQVTAPRITRVFPLSYASPANIRDLLKQYSEPIGAGYVSPTILVDENTESIVIQDTAEGIDKAKKIIRLLDVQTPQVIIEAKVIDATESFTRSLDGKFDLGLGGLTASINGGLAGATSTAGSGGSATTSTAGATNTFKFGIGNTFSLNALLNYSEGDSKAKIISTPRVLVLSGKQAKITQGSNLAVKQTTMTNGQVVETTTFVPYNTSLNITPRATNDGSVLMKLDLSRDTVVIDQSGQSSVAPRNVTTEVIVDSGNTLVIGGVQSASESEASGGFPFLRKLPLLGWLFGKETSITDKNELMFFVTPRILNVKKTSIGDGSDAEGRSSKL